MKKFCFFLVLLLATGVEIFPQDGFQVWTLTTGSVGRIYAIVADPANQDVMYAGGLDQGVVKTTDRGLTWSQVITGLTNINVQALAICNSNPQVLYAGTNGGIYKTTSGGSNWAAINTGIVEPTIGVQAIAVSPVNPDLAWAAIFDGVTDSQVGLYRTTDGGQNWVAANSGVGDIKNFLSVAIDPSDPSVLYAGTSFMVATSTGPSKIYKSVDAGATWTDASNGLPSDPTEINPVRAIQVSQDNPNLVIAGLFMNTATGGIYVSTDGGTNWTRKFDGAPQDVGTLIRSCLITPGNQDEFFVGLDRSTITNIGVWHTTDGGTNWTSFNGGSMLDTYTIRALYYRTQGESTLFAGCASTTGQGIYEYTFEIIPVEFTSFTANVNGNSVTLNWSTATETNNSGFSIERKATGGNWQTMGFVNGSGNSTVPVHYSFTDQSVPTGKYAYRLKQVDYDGSYSYSSEVSIELLTVNSFSLFQNYPNPFNPSTHIKFSIPSDEFVTLKVFDILGREVATLVNERHGTGEYTINFNASALPSGIYYYSIIAGSFKETRKMILAK